MEAQEEVALTNRAILRFAIPSLLGLFLFLVPLPVDGNSTIIVAVFASFLNEIMQPILPVLILAISLLSALLALICSGRNINQGVLGKLFRVSPYWLFIRCTGAILTLMVFFQIGPEAVWGTSTGQTMVGQLVPTVMTLFLAVIFLLPLMTEYGIMEFVGVLVSRFFRFLFRLPGRGAIDAMASWLGAAPLGALVTTQQYERGHYSKREALSIISSFSLASVAFCLLIASILEITHIFPQFYGSVAIVSVVLAIVVCRLPPLIWIANTYHVEARKTELVPAGESTWNWAVKQAVLKASDAAPLPQQIQQSALRLLDLWFGLIPTVIAIGTLALMVAEFTPFFNWVAYPFQIYLQVLGVPEASAAAPSMVVGFADMILPAVLGSGIESELTRFVIAGISVTQVIYMSEIGALILRSQIETTIQQLAGIFVLRTIIAIPLLVLLGRLLLSAD